MFRVAPKPQLTLSMSAAAAKATTTTIPRPKLSLCTTDPSAAPQSCSSPLLSPRSPRSPLLPPPGSPTAINTAFNRRGGSSQHLQVPLTYSCGSSYSHNLSHSYSNSSHTKSILKKHPASSSASSSSSSSSTRKRAHINALPTAVHSITPIDDADYWYKPSRW